MRGWQTTALPLPSREGRGPRSSGSQGDRQTVSRRVARSARRSPGSGPSRWSDSEEPLQAAPVEPRDHLIIDRDDGDGHPARLRDQLLPRYRVLGDVLGDKGNPLRRKKLFRRMTGLSGRRPVDCDVPARHDLSLLRRPPKTRSPSLKASDTRVPAPATSGFAARHARRCSSDRKKLSVVQSEVEARRSPSPCLPTQTMTPSASSPEPAWSTQSSNGSPQWWQRDRMRTQHWRDAQGVDCTARRPLFDQLGRGSDL